jgi:hypothetical protein
MEDTYLKNNIHPWCTNGFFRVKNWGKNIESHEITIHYHRIPLNPYLPVDEMVFLKPKSPRHQDGFYWARSQNAPDLVRRGVSVFFG